MGFKQDLIDFFTNKRVLILGFGREGRSTYHFLTQNVSCKEIAVADQNDPRQKEADTNLLTGCTCFFGKQYLDSLYGNWDIIMKTPGIALLHFSNQEIRNKITCQTDLFLRFCPNPTIGVTGTKGKSTTSSLIYHILHENGKDVKLNGNIGTPVFSDIDKIEPNTIIVSEMSCHQLEYTSSSPRIAVLVNLYPDHLDHYDSYEAYKQAKYHIFLYQKPEDTLFISNTCPDIDMEIVQNLPQKKIYIGHSMKEQNFCAVSDSMLQLPKTVCANTVTEQEEIPLERMKTTLPGQHNLWNIAVAVTISKMFGISTEDAIRAVQTFRGLEHRMEYVGTFCGVRYYNDSISTIPQSTVLNAQTLPDLKTMIIGGMDRGIDYTPLIQFLTQAKIENIIFAYESGKRIYEEVIKNPHTSQIYYVEDLQQAVRLAKQITADGSCLFSPAAASYGYFKNFEERGKYFKQLVQNSIE